eukprot:TRINITY_DN2407_c0_g1::TRINITY_DN2407_c0_g1_i1::g.9013::m.9013 TRINITY_DN2407_c0_g1::TRINITY_DN2407_c0_g1_i1::g.9013  ORF type:complete len:164 (-),score=50.15,sp/O73872/SODC_DANRE/61.84/1e-60,Sod_Cu/PF00080.15/7.5e-48 TRINITY_DN2407_c0_g1_i1:413-874(-)
MVLKAVAYLVGASCKATVRFEQEAEDKPTTVSVEASGLKAGDHGFHIHAFGDLTNGCISAGPHFNPDNKSHGAPTDTERHVGDLGNIQADAEGNVKYTLQDSLIKLTGPRSIVGRAVVIHENVDDLGKGGHETSLTTGNAGGRLMCGVVGVYA